jgi:hypothetical protein
MEMVWGGVWESPGRKPALFGGVVRGQRARGGGLVFCLPFWALCCSVWEGMGLRGMGGGNIVWRVWIFERVRIGVGEG